MTTIPLAGSEISLRKSRGALFNAFWIGIVVTLVAILLTAHPQYGESVIGAIMIGAAALLPMALWVSRRVQGLPLFPIFAITHLGAFGLPLLYEHPVVSLFTPEKQITGAVSVAVFLLLGTGVWYFLARRPSNRVTHCLTMRTEGADVLLILILAVGVIFTVVTGSNWVDLPQAISPVLRAVVTALEGLACFVLSFRMGERRLNPANTTIFLILFAVLLISSLPSLVMVGAMSMAGIAVLGYTLGGKRFPWKSAVAGACVFALLHAGKGDMRDEFWTSEEQVVVSPREYPNFFSQWIAISWHKLFTPSTAEEEEARSLLERASLMQLLLYVQTMTPNDVPYLSGETYAIIPSLLVPRMFNPEKIRSHEGTYILNIHYGFQTREATERTTIGFGLLNEAFANFGFPGMAGFAIVLGAYYGMVERWARHVPILSFRSLFAILVASYSFQTEFAAGVYVSALFQSTVALLALAAAFMRTKAVDPDDEHLLE